MKFKLKETWKTIKEFPNYEVSTYGNVRNVKTGKILKPNKDKDNYLYVNLYNNSKFQSIKIHVLVAKAFLPDTGRNPDGSIMVGHHQVNHRDECKTNNNLLNLEWCDSKYNLNYSNIPQKGQDSIKKQVQCIETGVVYESTFSAERSLNLKKNSINRQINPKCLQKHCTLQNGTKIHFKYI